MERMPSLEGKDILTTKNIGRDTLETLFAETDATRSQIAGRGLLEQCNGAVLCTGFMEPSTRTRLSFHFAMVRLGGTVIDFGPAEAASIAKGETFEDTMQMVDNYSPDVIVVRNKSPGSAGIAANICAAPVINGGDGPNEHPTQAMLDLYTMKRIRGELDGLKIGLMGDLAHSRTVSSLSYALDAYDAEIAYIAPHELQVKKEVIESLRKARIQMVESFDSVMEQLDFLYVTRLQKERFADPKEYEKFKGSYILSRKSLSKYSRIPYIMHPLPRVDELSSDLDTLPEAKYFEQAKNGVFVRAALLKQVLGR